MDTDNGAAGACILIGAIGVIRGLLPELLTTDGADGREYTKRNCSSIIGAIRVIRGFLRG